jgi:hypothetical protein
MYLYENSIRKPTKNSSGGGRLRKINRGDEFHQRTYVCMGISQWNPLVQLIYANKIELTLCLIHFLSRELSVFSYFLNNDSCYILPFIHCLDARDLCVSSTIRKPEAVQLPSVGLWVQS